MEATEKTIFWHTSEDAEQLRNECIEDAVKELQNDIHPEPVPPIIRVYGYSPKDFPDSKWVAEHVAENVLEMLDEDHGNPDDMATRPSDSLLEAAIKFVEVLKSEYVIQACELVETKTIETADYLD